ncbi:MAG: citrate synthase [Phenylobacterium sp.]|uniref:citrate synthase n=1 Tax=Phenylobacterium sp. TaxID=1871053 RepID=UPI002732E21F|nr:citrate synthase [Phenylobacterium sp.]MDP3175571.1 citrate synthase [Phenylobacterium sp.]
MSEDWITAQAAIERLGVRPQTLYAYVSRGRVQVRADPGDPRRSLYRAVDLAALIERRTRGRKRSEVAAGAIAWGEPVMDSTITTVVGGRLFYRGRDAAVLAETETLEAVARLLWNAPSSARQPTPLRSMLAGGLKARAFNLLASRAASDRPALGRQAAALRLEAEDLLDAVSQAVAGDSGPGSIHLRLASAWDVDALGADLIRRALVLLADHELNASTFAARVAASTGASLAACALAGLATLTGPLHGGAAAGVAALLADAARDGAQSAVTARLAEGRAIPGFGHPLYQDGDPRAQALLGRFTPAAAAQSLSAAVHEATGAAPNIDFALAAMTQAISAPADAPFALFATARVAGWIAHALEQGAGGMLIRPRARYVGPHPELMALSS